MSNGPGPRTDPCFSHVTGRVQPIKHNPPRPITQPGLYPSNHPPIQNLMYYLGYLIPSIFFKPFSPVLMSHRKECQCKNLLKIQNKHPQSPILSGILFLTGKSREVRKPHECPTFDFSDKPVYIVCSIALYHECLSSLRSCYTVYQMFKYFTDLTSK